MELGVGMEGMKRGDEVGRGKRNVEPPFKARLSGTSIREEVEEEEEEEEEMEATTPKTTSRTNQRQI